MRRLAQRVRVRAPGATRVTTLLLPADGGPAEVTHVTDDAGEGLVVARAGGRHVVRFGPGRVEGLETDARAAWARLGADGAADRFLVAGGGRLSLGELSVTLDGGSAANRGAAAGVREAGGWRTEGLSLRFGR